MGKKNIPVQLPHEYISGTTKNHLEDFFLMQHCRHNIIANSSFSWWCAWLNNHEDKSIIAPKNGLTKLITTLKT